MAASPIHKPNYIFISLLGLLSFVAGFVLRPKLSPSAALFPSPPIPNIDMPSPPASWSNQVNLPGNSFTTAFNLTPGYDTSGSLSSQNIEDYYTFNLDHPAKVRLTGTNTPQDYRWYLYDRQQQLIASTVRSGVVEGMSTVVLQTPGRYYIRILGKYSEINSLPYVIRLDIMPFFN